MAVGEYKINKNSNDNIYTIIELTCPLDDIINYQVEMIGENLELGIIPINVMAENNIVKLYYDTSDKISLCEYLKVQKLSKNEKIEMLQSVIRTIKNSKNYLLYENSFILDLNYIYIEQNSSKVQVMYLPIKLDFNINQNIRSLINEVVGVDTGEIDISYVDLLKQLELLKIKSAKIELTNTYEIKNKIKRSNKVYKKPESKNNKSNKPDKVKKKDAQSIVKRKKNYSITKQKKNLIIFGLTQLVLIIIITIILKFANNVDSTTYAGILILVIAVDFLILKRLVKSKENINNNNYERQINEPSVPMRKAKKINVGREDDI
ncbi:DUF6382 domain-containing protein [Abyssisolibacter fermentans]|uniref:DUF6382 domain-containing protein n=1 Tax=Abyssisolibacter fermentans TaxID=1766203 RepID=UPI00082C49E8|nr:DUF6382 domain-containing protein [Abyssisolibacter fermentans]